VLVHLGANNDSIHIMCYWLGMQIMGC